MGWRRLLFSTFLGGRGGDYNSGLVLDGRGGAYLAGDTLSPDYPVKNAYQSRYGGGNFDGIVALIRDATPLPPSPLSVSPARLTFRYVQGESLPGPLSATVGGGAFTSTADAAWIRIGPATITSQALAVDPGNLAPGTYTGVVRFTPANGTSATVDVSLTVLAPAAVLTAIDPPLVTLGSDDTVVTLRGRGFAAGATVYVDGNPWTVSRIAVVDSSTIRVPLPKSFFSAESSWAFAVQNPNSDRSNILPFGR